MRKTLSPLAWSTSLNEALWRPTYRINVTGYFGNLSTTGHTSKLTAVIINYKINFKEGNS